MDDFIYQQYTLLPNSSRSMKWKKSVQKHNAQHMSDISVKIQQTRLVTLVVMTNYAWLGYIQRCRNLRDMHFNMVFT